MNKSLLVASFAVLAASVFGMDSDKITENKRQFSLSPVNKEPDKKRMKSNNQDVRDFLRRVVKENINLKKQLSEEKSRNDKNEKDNRRIMGFLRDISNEHTENISEISELKDQKENVENKNTELERIIQKKESDIKKVSKNLFVSELSKAKPNNKNRVLQYQTNKLQKENEDLKKKLRESQNSNRQLETENQKLKRKKEDLENSLQIKNQTITEYQGELKSLESEIQKLTQEKDAKIQELRDKLSFMQQRLIKANNDVFNKLYEKSSHKRSRSVGEEEIQRELNSNKLRNVISQNNETISEYRKRQKSLESENQKLKILLKNTATELKEIQNLQKHSSKRKRSSGIRKPKINKTNQEKEKRIADFQNQENNLKQKLDEVNQKLEKQKTKKLKGFQGEVLNTIQNLEIDVSKYEAFPRLKKLVIKSDEVSDILWNKPDLSKLTILDIYNCDEKPLQITELSELLHLARNIEGLDLSSCNLTFLPEGVGNLKNLRKLNLSYNNLTSLPKGIGNLTKLENLYLRKNQLTELPAEIYALPKLKGLDIRNNPLEKLSRGMFVFSNTEIHQ